MFSPSTGIGRLAHGADGTTSFPTEASPALSPVAMQWLADLASPGCWPLTEDRRPHAEFLIEILTVLRVMDVFPGACDLLVSWVLLDREAAAEAPSRFLPATDPDASTLGKPCPWISGYYRYDGSASIGVGEIQRVDDEARPVLVASEPMEANRAFDLIAQAAREARARLGQERVSCCHDGATLRRALSEHLQRHPEIVETLAMRFPLGLGYRSPALSSGQRRANCRAALNGLRKGSGAPSEYRLPAEVIRALLPRVEAGDVQLQSGLRPSLGNIARSLRLSPTCFALSFTDSGRLTCHGRQSLRPDLVRPSSIDAMRAARKWNASGSWRARDLFNERHDLAEALEKGLVSRVDLHSAAWYGDPDPDGGAG